MSRALTADGLAGIFGRTTLNRGANVWKRGLVSDIAASADGQRITGRVRGSAQRPYDQTVSIIPGRGGEAIRIVGYCTCPMRRNCKHVAALVLKHLANLEEKEAIDANGADAPAAASAQPVPQLALSGNVSAWLDRVAAATPQLAARVDAGAAAYKPNQRRLLFILNPRDTATRTSPTPVLVHAVSVRLGKNGSFNDVKHYEPSSALNRTSLEQLPRFITADDCAILRDLAWMRQRGDIFNRITTMLSADAAGLF